MTLLNVSEYWFNSESICSESGAIWNSNESNPGSLYRFSESFLGDTGSTYFPFAFTKCVNILVRLAHIVWSFADTKYSTIYAELNEMVLGNSPSPFMYRAHIYMHHQLSSANTFVLNEPTHITPISTIN